MENLVYPKFYIKRGVLRIRYLSLSWKILVIDKAKRADPAEVKCWEVIWSSQPGMCHLCQRSAREEFQKSNAEKPQTHKELICRRLLDRGSEEDTPFCPWPLLLSPLSSIFHHNFGFTKADGKRKIHKGKGKKAKANF